MPCYDYRDSHGGCNCHNETSQSSVMAGLLCEAMQLYTGVKARPSAKLMAWWEEHQERDKRRRIQKEKELKEKLERKKAVAKLSERERKLLGIKE